MTALTSTCAFTGEAPTIVGLLGEYGPAGTSEKGPLPTANNHTGVQRIAVSMTGTTAKTWTHSHGVFPAKIEVIGTDGREMEASEVVVTTTTSSITLTPTRTCNVYVNIWWALPSQYQDGVPSTNFAAAI